MFESCLHKQEEMKKLFLGCLSVESKYQKIIDLGKEQRPLPAEHKREENLVAGCQSRMYLHSFMESGKLFFECESDAIISAGLAALLIRVYSGEPPQVILKCPPKYIEELGIPQTLTPGRANGLASLYIRMKKEALRYFLLETQNSG